jgi:hypothetical protein
MSGSGHSRKQKHQNRVPFVAKRDIKRNDGDREKESALRHLACQNVCKRCRQKVVWRFQMGKYKPKRAGTRGRCNSCGKQTVKLAYRSLCDPCGKEQGLCPGCQKPPELADLSREVKVPGETESEEEEDEEEEGSEDVGEDDDGGDA